MKEVYLIVGVSLWGLTVIVESYLGHEIIDGQCTAPCRALSKFSGFNLIYVGFPLALILMAEVQYMDEVGALGLTPMIETVCLLGIVGMNQIYKMHTALCIGAGLALCCFSLNVMKLEYALTVSIPLVVVALMSTALNSICHCKNDDTGKRKQNTILSMILLFLNLWSIFTRLLLLFPTQEKSEWHYFFDIISFGAILILLTLMWIAVHLCGCELL